MSSLKSPNPSSLYFEDFEVGEKLTTASFTITKENAIAFAREYDPQYYHIDEEAAKAGPYGRLIVSGWQTAAINMKLKAGSRLAQVEGGLLGLGLDGMRWLKPVYPDDTLHLIITITDKRPSGSRPTHGIMKYKMETFNQHGELVMITEPAVWVPRKK